MLTVTFYDQEAVDERLLSFAVIAARYRGKWIFCRQKTRDTWEMPGGHREKGESALDAAERELREETGATAFELTPLCVYSVAEGEQVSYGLLCIAYVKTLGALSPEFEIGEITFTDCQPENLTYPAIQPYLFEKARRACAMTLLPYSPADADGIMRWTDSERAFYQWSAGILGDYPQPGQALTTFYQANPSVLPLTARNASGAPVGHFLLREKEPGVIRIGLVILSPALRGRGAGVSLVLAAAQYAKENLNARALSLGVFLNNPAAERCYAAAGFVRTGEIVEYQIKNERWLCAEMLLKTIR